MKSRSIPNWTYLPEYTKEKKQILKAIDVALGSGKLILGKHVEAFEKAFAKFCQAKYAIGVNSGTDAITISLKALGVTTGDEVITVANSAIPTATAIIAAGGTPVFVDILPDTLLMDSSKLEAAITKKTKVIIPVHLYGQCCDMDKIIAIAKKHKLKILEDCAQATGAKWRGKTVGSMGDIASFSFYPTKIIGAYGDGGAIVTNNKMLAEKIRMLRMYGNKKEYYSYFPGFNSRLDEIQAAILLHKLRKTKKEITIRQTIAKRYNTLLRDTNIKRPLVDPQAVHVWHLYVVRSQKRDALIAQLEKNGIGIKIHYPFPLHTMKGFGYLGYKKGDFPVTEQASREIFSLPLYPQLTHAQQEYIASCIKRFDS